MSLQSHLGIDVDHVQTLKAGSRDRNDELGAEAEDWETQEYHERKEAYTDLGSTGFWY
jgi:hypothetical protein